MHLLTFLIQSLKYYRKQHLITLMAVAVTTAVICGALVTGDSIRQSLQKLVDVRLGSIAYAMPTGDRFVSGKLAGELGEKLSVRSAGVLLVQGVCSNPETNALVNRTQVIGVDADFQMFADGVLQPLDKEEVILSLNMAERLQIGVGDKMILRIENRKATPSNAPFSADETPAAIMRATVVAIADDAHLGRFSLRSNQVAPFTVFVSRYFLCDKLELGDIANLIVVDRHESGKIGATELNGLLSKVWQPIDAGLEITTNDTTDYYELTSNRVFIDHPICDAIREQLPSAQFILSYLVNSIRFQEKATPYSFVSALPESMADNELTGNRIAIGKWLANDLGCKVADSLELSFFVIDQKDRLVEKLAEFIVQQIFPTPDELYNVSLMPKFPWLENAINCVDWNTNLPINLKKIREKDEEYWTLFKGTPKAVISYVTGKTLWENSYGKCTAIRFNKADDQADVLKKKIMSGFGPEQLNFRFYAVREEGQQAAVTGVDFGELFLSLSLFVILAGILLTVMVISLNMEARRMEFGTLLSLGFTGGRLLRERLGENAWVVFLGSVLGMLLGLVYTRTIMWVINNHWNDIVRTDALEMYIQPKTLCIGGIAGFFIGLGTLFIVVYRKKGVTVIGFLQESTILPKLKQIRLTGLRLLLGITGIVGSVLLLVFAVANRADMDPTLFLSAGALFLFGGIAVWGRIVSGYQLTNGNMFGIMRFALKNLGRNFGQNRTVVVLLSLGAFIIVITGANRETFQGDQLKRNSGTGGFSYWAQTAIPISEDLTTLSGKKAVGFDPKDKMLSANFFSIDVLEGDDASCLNINKVRLPSLAGVPCAEFDSLGCFSFTGNLLTFVEGHSWKILDQMSGEGLIPAYADQSVITWGLGKKLGDTLTYFNEAGEPLKVWLAGGLQNSVFQGYLLIGQDNFRNHFPSSSGNGSSLFLVDAPIDNKLLVEENLRYILQDYGLEIESTTTRMERYYSVTNTYLNVFMTLGALGVFIGTIGLAIVIYRNMQQRRSEFAICMATGFSKKTLFSIVLLENVILVAVSIFLGGMAGLIGIFPSLTSISYKMSSTSLLFFLFLIALSSFFCIYFSVWKGLKGNLIQTLQIE